MKLISQTQTHSISGGLDTVKVMGEEFTTKGVNDWCAVASASALNWEIANPSMSIMDNPFFYMMEATCTHDEMDLFLDNNEDKLDLI